MNCADLVRADHEAMLIIGTLVSAQQDPAIWERFSNRMFDDWAKQAERDAEQRAASTNEAIAAFGRLAASRAAQPGVDAPSADHDSQPSPNPTAGSEASV